MPMHDWTKVEAGIFHAHHHRWISAIADFLNSGKLPGDYYALPEQVAAGFGPVVLTLQSHDPAAEPGGGSVATAVTLQTRPQTQFTMESEGEFYRRRQSSIVVRHVSGDRIVAMIEIVSSGNKAGQAALQAFVAKVCELLEHRIHLLIVDPFPPGNRDPRGMHAEIWEQWTGESFQLPHDRPLAAMAYESEVTTRAYLEAFAVGQPLPDMPLFLEPNGCVMVPLEATYQTAFDMLPMRWQRVLE